MVANHSRTMKFQQVEVTNREGFELSVQDSPNNVVKSAVQDLRPTVETPFRSVESRLDGFANGFSS